MSIDELTKADGVCINYRWAWLIGTKPVTRQVNAAIKRGELKPMYFAGGRAAVNKNRERKQ